MKKNFFRVLTLAVAALPFVSCGAKTETAKEDAKAEKVEEVAETPAAEAALDASIPGINNTKYNQAFFMDEANKGTEPSADKYVTTESGLKYVIVEPGKGTSPTATDVVTVHYIGELVNGEQFDSSVDRGEPTSFPLNRVIPGWTEGLQLMKPGGVAVFYIPYQLAYGEAGMRDPYTGQVVIPQSAPLIFWVQLLEVKK